MKSTDKENKNGKDINETDQKGQSADNFIKDESHIPKDLIDDLNKNKIDSLTDGSTNLGYDERAPRKKELEQKEHLDQDDK